MATLHQVQTDEKKKAILVAIQLPRVTDEEVHGSLDELSRLVTTLGYEVVGRLTQKRSGTGSAAVLGEGKLEELVRITRGRSGSPQESANGAIDEDEIADEADETTDEFGDELQGGLDEFSAEALETGEQPDIVIFDHELSPSQLRNVEKACGCSVMDRTGVIIEIFSRHARTRAARLQVEIARLTYLAPRLRETTKGTQDRQGGGIGGKGAGESALELDKRKIRDRIKELKDEFASIEQEHLTRRSRRSEVRTVALVGYTNAGKSSLMRAMTGSEVLVADQLFATLDTTVRPLVPPSRPPVLVSDTVGFIKKLPHDLVASFQSTLDEATNAALLLYVVDSSDPAFRSQLEVTQSVLKEVGAESLPSILVLNKRDRLSEEQSRSFEAEFPKAIQISTRDPNDIARLRDYILAHVESEMVDEEILIPFKAMAAVAELRAQMRVLEESYEEEGVKLQIRATPSDLARFKARLRARIEDTDFKS